MDREKLLTIAVKRLVDEHGFRPIDTLKDRGGRHAFVMRGYDRTVYLVAKEEVWDGTMASILEKTVRVASNRKPKLIVCYFHDLGEFHVFDSVYVDEKGRRKRAKSKTHITTWVEVPMNAGCKLGDYLRGKDRPAKIDTTRESTLSRFE